MFKKYSKNDTQKVVLGTKIIYKYPSPTKLFDVAKMVVSGRNPENADTFLLETDCQFVMYVTKGNGKYYLEDQIVDVEEGDVVFVDKNTKFAVEGNFEYITVDVPAFYPEQSKEVKNGS